MARVSKDGHRPQRVWPSFETPASRAPQDEVRRNCGPHSHDGDEDTSAQPDRRRRRRALRQRPAARGDRRALRAREPRPCARDGGGAQGDRGRLGIALVFKTSFDKANRTSAGSARGIGLDEALPIFAEIRASARPSRAHRRARERAVRARGGSRRRAADPRVPVPADRSPRRRRAHRQGRQRQEGPVPRPLGHGERRRQDHRRRQCECAGHRARRLVRLQHPRLRHARAADPRAGPARR